MSDTSTRVVVTGMGVVAPNANSVAEFELALRKGQSGIRRNEQFLLLPEQDLELAEGDRIVCIADGRPSAVARRQR